MAQKRRALCDLTNVIDVFGKDVSACPHFSHSTIEKYLPNIELRRKSYNFFIEGYVSRVLFCANVSKGPNECCFKARCLPSLKAGTYQVQVFIHIIEGRIISADCGCPAGLSGDCHHVGALLYVIAGIKIQGLSTIPDDQTCTDLPCAWINPNAGKKSGRPIRDLDIIKVDKVPSIEEFVEPLKRKLKKRHYDPRHPSDRGVKFQAIQLFYENLKQITPNCAFVTYFDRKQFCVLEDIQVSGPSGLQASVQPSLSIKKKLSVESICSETFQAEVAKYIDERYPPISQNEQGQIENSTKGQGENPVWHSEKAKRMTASKFKSFVTMSVDPDKLIKRIIYDKVHPTKAMQRGMEMEGVAVECYIRIMQNKGEKIVVSNCGLVVHKENSILAASPYRFVTFENFDCGLLEVKCPSSPNALTSNHRASCLILGANGRPTLKTNHEYYFQIQGQLAVCELSWCDFFIWKSDEDYHLERVPYSLEFWRTNMFPYLMHFAHYAFVPELLLENVKEGRRLYKFGTYTPLRATSEDAFHVSALNGLKITLKPCNWVKD